MKSKGHEFYLLSPPEKKRFADTTQVMYADWVKSMEKKGSKNAGKILDDVMQTGKTYSQKTVGGYKE